MMSIDIQRLREVADQARAAAETALSQRDAREWYDGPDLSEETYAQGVEDVLRWLAGDARPTNELALVLVSGGAHIEQSDGSCSDECVAVHPDHAETRGEE